jgi:L-2-hydroxyglutarate oxidase LhgO
MDLKEHELNNEQMGSAVDKVDVAVIGAGVVGLAVARALALQGREVIVIEKELSIGQGVSSRNSEVVHAGLQYTPGSLKAQLSVRGKQLLYDYCPQRGVNIHSCGKLVVATDPSQHEALRQMQAKATANGVPTQWLSAAQAMAMEPHLYCTAALQSPTTGIVDSHSLMLALQGDLENAGGVVALGTQVLSVQLQTKNYQANTDKVHVISAQAATESVVTTLQANTVINAASLHACALARCFDGLAVQHIPQEYFAKGSYYSLAGKSPFRQLIYPAPQDAWLGVHVTLDLGGQSKFGPDLEWLDVQHADDIDYAVDPARADKFYSAVRKYWPALQDGALLPSYSGVRPKIYGPGMNAPDFRIDGPKVHGVQGLVNLFGIESPGLTSSMAIGEYAAQMLSIA